jgi:hypothetical protein
VHRVKQILVILLVSSFSVLLSANAQAKHKVKPKPKPLAPITLRTTHHHKMVVKDPAKIPLLNQPKSYRSSRDFLPQQEGDDPRSHPGTEPEMNQKHLPPRTIEQLRELPHIDIPGQ